MADFYVELNQEEQLGRVDTPELTATTRALGVGGWIGVAWLVLILLIAIVGPFLTADPIVTKSGFVIEACGDGSGLPIYDPFQCVDHKALGNQRAGNGAEGKFTHLMGVDASGRDVFSRMVVGTRTTLIIAVGSILIAVTLGGALGIAGGYFGRATRATVGGLFDVLLAFPQLILALAIVSFLQRSVLNITLTLAIVAIPLLGRIARASALTWSERDFVTAAKAMGAKQWRVVTREVLPNVTPALMSITLLSVGVVIVAEASLSIIGLGVPSSAVSWGAVLGAGGADFHNYPHMVFIPLAAICLTVMALNLVGDALRRKYDVREAAI
jgi:peptide/nickel transport system permease protein